MTSAAFVLSMQSDAPVDIQLISSPVGFKQCDLGVWMRRSSTEEEYTAVHRWKIVANAERPPRRAIRERLRESVPHRRQTRLTMKQ